MRNGYKISTVPIAAGGDVSAAPVPDGPGFGGLLRGYRLAAGLTQEELAERAGLSARAVADMERGRTARPFRRSVEALADALELDSRRRALMSQSSRSAGPAAGLVSGGQAWPTPRQLPAAAPNFAGRAVELGTLSGLLEPQAGNAAGTVVISAIAGTAGVGKTGLALHWAHQVADRFPDGQLYVNLRGYDPGPPVSAADALAAFLRALSVPGPLIPAETEERAARYRSLVAGRRMLILLDNARDSAHVRPLLPGAARCVAVVTSRDSLAGLVARDGARRIELDVLPLEDAVGLLRALIGARAEADPCAAVALAERCGRLPLALRVAAELATDRPATPLAELAAELGDRQQGLDLLDAGGDPGTAVRAVLSWSRHHLEAGADRAFRLLALHPGPDFDAYAAAALTDTGLPEARTALDRLARAHLIQPAAPGRFGLHDLLRRYAADEAVATMTPGEREKAHARLLDYLQHTASRAQALSERRTRSSVILHPPLSEYALPDLANRAQARAWLRAERPVLMACLDAAAADGQQARLVALTAGLTGSLRDDGTAACPRHAAAVVAAHDLGDRHAEANALFCLGDAQVLTDDPAAGETLARARDLFADLGDRLGLADVLRMLGFWQGRAGVSESAKTLAKARDLFYDLGDQFGLASTLMPLAEVQRLGGNYANAVALAGAALTIFDALGDREGRANALLRLGLAQLQTESLPVAARAFCEALGIYRELGIRRSEANALRLLGAVQSETGDYAAAVQNLTEARGIYRHLDQRHDEADALRYIGIVRSATGDLAGAFRDLTESLVLFRGHPLGQADVLMALGDVQSMTGDYLAAERNLAEALALCRAAEAPGFETEVMNKTGSLDRARGDVPSAVKWHEQALDRARRLAMPLEEGRALAGLARCARLNRDDGAACTMFRQAHAILARTGAADARAVASELDSLRPASTLSADPARRSSGPAARQALASGHSGPAISNPIGLPHRLR
jgi:tetratricopeptide (TPR) repeat protein